MDTLRIEQIAVNALIGTLPHERQRRQNLLIDVEIGLNLQEAARLDDLSLSVDYSEIERRTVEIAENSSFRLLEALAGAVGNMLLSYTPVRRAQLFSLMQSCQPFLLLVRF